MPTHTRNKDNAMKKLQVALDLFDAKSALGILEQVGEYIDIIELGTPLMISEGKRIVSEVKKRYPNKIVFADIKVMDGGAIVPEIVFKEGADIASIMAVADDATIKGAIACAKKFGAKILVDMCSVPDIAARAKQVDAFGPDIICVHVGTDIQASGLSPVSEVAKLAGVSCEKAGAGGIKMDTFEAACQSPLDIIIVGGGMIAQPNPRETAKAMYDILQKHR